MNYRSLSRGQDYSNISKLTRLVSEQEFSNKTSNKPCRTSFLINIEINLGCWLLDKRYEMGTRCLLLHSVRYHLIFLWSFHLSLWNRSRAGNRFVSQIRAPLTACREPTRKLWQLCKVLYVFEHKTQYLLIHAPYTRIVIFWHISNIPPMISKSQNCFNTATFYTAVIFVKYCYTWFHRFILSFLTKYMVKNTYTT